MVSSVISSLKSRRRNILRGARCSSSGRRGRNIMSIPKASRQERITSIFLRLEFTNMDASPLTSYFAPVQYYQPLPSQIVKDTRSLCAGKEVFQQMLEPTGPETRSAWRSTAATSAYRPESPGNHLTSTSQHTGVLLISSSTRTPFMTSAIACLVRQEAVGNQPHVVPSVVYRRSSYCIYPSVYVKLDVASGSPILVGVTTLVTGKEYRGRCRWGGSYCGRGTRHADLTVSVRK